MQPLFNFIERLRQYPWRRVFEGTGSLVGFLIRSLLVIFGCPSVEGSLAAVSIAKRVIHLYRKSGPLYTALYLKQCGVALQRTYALSVGYSTKGRSDGICVSLTRCGLPRIIPKYHRQLIRARDSRADRLVRLYLSWFTLAKVIKLAKPVRKATFSSITTPVKDIEEVKRVLSLIRGKFSTLQPIYLPHIASVVLEKGMRWLPTWKALPNSDRMYDKKAIPNVFASLKYEIAAFADQLNLIHSMEGIFSPVILYEKEVLVPLDNEWNRMVCNRSLSLYENHSLVRVWFSSLAKALEIAVPFPRPGRIASAVEGAGKRRLFAIGNYIKQRLLAPVHDWAMKILSGLPCDGTFEQERPIHRLAQRYRGGKIYSFDLSSATDRWPLSVIHDVLLGCLGPTAASGIVNGCLGLNAFDIGPPLVKGRYRVCFVAGQPLGYLGSWPLFALSHHYIVWLAAHTVYPSSKAPFRRYALLGDDIVIADEAVALEYRKLLERLQVSISESKSIVSDIGALEFAKRYWVKDLQVDLSPVSLKALLAVRSSVGLCALGHKYKANLVAVMRLGGAGFRVRGSLKFGSLSRKWARLRRIYMKPVKDSLLPLDWWIAGGMPPDPYKVGIIATRLMERLKPKQLQLPPEEVVQEAERQYCERTVYRNWLSQWLRSVRDYCLLWTVEEVTLERILDIPVCAHSWQTKQFDENIFKFGLLWKCVDWYTEMPAYWHRAIGSSVPVGSFVAEGAVHYYSQQFHLVVGQMVIIEDRPKSFKRGFFIVRQPNP